MTPAAIREMIVALRCEAMVLDEMKDRLLAYAEQLEGDTNEIEPVRDALELRGVRGREETK